MRRGKYETSAWNAQRRIHCKYVKSDVGISDECLQFEDENMTYEVSACKWKRRM